MNLLQRMRIVAKRDAALSDYLIWRELDEVVEEAPQVKGKEGNMEVLTIQSQSIDWRIGVNGRQQAALDEQNDKEVELFDWNKCDDRLTAAVVAKNLHDFLAGTVGMDVRDSAVLVLEVTELA